MKLAIAVCNCRVVAFLAGCVFFIVYILGLSVVSVAAVEPVLKIGTVNLSLVYFFHPRMREYDFVQSRFVKYDPEIAALDPADRLKARRERATRRVEEMASGEFKQEMNRLRKKLNVKREKFKDAKKNLEDLVCKFRKRVASETRGLSLADPVREEIKSRQKELFEQDQRVLIQKISICLQEIEVIEEAVNEKRFLVAPPDTYTDFMETDRIYWGIRADVRKSLEAVSREKGLAVLVNTSYLIQDFIPFAPVPPRPMESIDSTSWEDMMEETCRTRGALPEVFPFTLDMLVIPGQDGVEVVDYTAEAVEKLLALYGASEVEISVTREIIAERLAAKPRQP